MWCGDDDNDDDDDDDADIDHDDSFYLHTCLLRGVIDK